MCSDPCGFPSWLQGLGVPETSPGPPWEINRVTPSVRQVWKKDS